VNKKFISLIGLKAARTLRARADSGSEVWSGLGMMGIIGWSVVIPSLIGTALGIWLDRRGAGGHSWTLALLVGGLSLGCLNAWQWVASQDREMHKENHDSSQ